MPDGKHEAVVTILIVNADNDLSQLKSFTTCVQELDNIYIQLPFI